MDSPMYLSSMDKINIVVALKAYNTPATDELARLFIRYNYILLKDK